MKYSKPELVIKKDNTDPLNMDEIYLGIGELFSIGIKRQEITGKTKEDCKKRGGKIKRVYTEDKDGNLNVMSVCEFEKNGKECLEQIKEKAFGSCIALPISMIDEVIKQLEELKK